jgi:hypothetical protein
MPEPHVAYLDRLHKAQGALVDALKEAAADKPAHALYLDALLSVRLDTLDDVTVPRGVSPRVADALLADVEWIRAEDPAPGVHQSGYPNAYRGLRALNQRRGAQAAAVQKSRRDGTAPALRTLLRF